MTPAVDSVTLGYGASQPTLTIDDVSDLEGTGSTTPLTFTVRLTPPSATPTTVQYSTSDGSASAGTDYWSVSGTLTFAPGVGAQTVTVDLIGDSIIELDEAFAVTLSGADGSVIGDATGVGTIIDDDTLPLIAIGNTQVLEGNSGTTSALLTLTLSTASGLPVTVEYLTVDGTATGVSDYTAATGAVVFTPGTTTQTISVAVIGDTTQEPNEAFTINLANPVNAALANTSGLATIVDDDSPVRTDALVLVNSTSAGYEGFTAHVKPYLDQFGVPYTVLDVAAAPVPANVGDYAVIVIGHRQIDPGHSYLDSTEQSALTAAVNAGTGLVNFDNDLSATGSPRYAFVQQVFNFGTGGSISGLASPLPTGALHHGRHAPRNHCQPAA